MYVQDTITKGNWSFNLGIRGDMYNGLATSQPSRTAAWESHTTSSRRTRFCAFPMRGPSRHPSTKTWFWRARVATTQWSTPCMALMQGYPCLTAPLSPGLRNEFHAGFQQAFGKYLVIDGEYIVEVHAQWRMTSACSATRRSRIPIEWHNSKIPGYMLRASVPNFHGFTRLFRGVQRGGAILPAASQRHRRDAGGARRNGSVPHRPRRTVQPDDPLAIPAVEARTVGGLQLAL